MTANRTASLPGVASPGGILDRIIAAKAERLAAAKARVPEKELVDALKDRPERARSLQAALQNHTPVNVIAEIKRSSPSRGQIRPDLDPASIATQYERGGAAAISILAEEDFFSGSLADVGNARRVVDLPLLRKDFIFDGYQVYETVSSGADALLLIVAMLEDGLLAELIGLSYESGIDALVEVHDDDELERASRAGAKIIGVNNRDLRTFDVSLDTSMRLAPLAPKGSILVAESGINNAGDINRLKSAGFSGFLIGEHLMRSDDPGKALAALIADV